MFLIYLFFGVVGGIFAGMGMGGGSLLVPLLVFFADIQQKSAQGNNLIAFLPMAFFALFFHKKNNLLVINKDIFVIMVIGVIVSVLSALFIGNVSNELLRRLFGAFLIVLAIMHYYILNKKKR